MDSDKLFNRTASIATIVAVLISAYTIMQAKDATDQTNQLINSTKGVLQAVNESIGLQRNAIDQNNRLISSTNGVLEGIQKSVELQNASIINKYVNFKPSLNFFISSINFTGLCPACGNWLFMNITNTGQYFTTANVTLDFSPLNACNLDLPYPGNLTDESTNFTVNLEPGESSAPHHQPVVFGVRPEYVTYLPHLKELWLILWVEVLPYDITYGSIPEFGYNLYHTNIEFDWDSATQQWYPHLLGPGPLGMKSCQSPVEKNPSLKFSLSDSFARS